MLDNKKQIKLILSDYIDTSDNYEQIKKRIHRKVQAKKYIKRSLAVSFLFLLVITIFLSFRTNFKMSHSKEDNIVINKVETSDNSSMIHSYKQENYNLIDEFFIFRYFNDLDIFKIEKQQVLYDDFNKIYLGSYSYISDSEKFLHLYLANVSIFEYLFQDCKLSTIDNNDLYIVNYEGIIFIKLIDTNQKIYIQTNITDTKVIVDIVKFTTKYLDKENTYK